MSGRERVPPLAARVSGPRADLDGTGPLVPAVALRVAVLVAGAVLIVLLVGGRPAGWLVLLLAGLVGGCAWAPGSVVVGVLGLLAVGAQLAYGDLGPRAAGTALALYGTWLSCALAAAVPAAGRVELAALGPALRRLAVVAACTVLLAGGAGAARAGGLRVGEQLLLLVGVVVLVGGVAVGVLLQERRPPDG